MRRRGTSGCGAEVRVVECAEFGPVTGLRVVERDPLPLGEGQIRLEVLAAGVNFVDGLFVQGAYQIKPPLPFVPGSEVVGRVVELGPGVDALAGAPGLGDRVFANVWLGGYASEVVVRSDQVVALPDVLSDGQGATFVQSYLTAWFALHERARIEAGSTVGVLGAGGGVGLATVDVARAAGAAVIGVASTPDKRDAAVGRGALEVVDGSASSPTEVKDALRAFAAANGGPPGGLDVLVDPVGGELGETCLRALGEDGQYLVIGFVAGIPRLPANQVLLRNRRIIGVDWGAWSGRHPDRNRALLDRVLAAIVAGELDPIEPATYPLEEAARALGDLERRAVTGKVALVP